MQKIDLTYIVDDDDILVMLVKILLQKNEFFGASQEFYNGEDALTHLKQKLANQEQLPNVILLDLNMPIMDGWQFLEAFVNLPLKSEIPIFIATSSIDPADIENAKKYSAVKGYIMKPLTQDKLNEIASKLAK